MRVYLNQSQFDWVEIVEGSLLIKKKKGDQAILSQGQVSEFAVTFASETVHIVAIVADRLVHWQGSNELVSHEVPTDQLSLNGLRLVTDFQGKIHMLYLEKNKNKLGCQLIHRQLKGDWGDPVRVCANVSSLSAEYDVCYSHDKYLHLVYSAQAEEMLLYRSFDLEKRVWSGAVPQVRNECDSPRLLPTDTGTLLIWVDRATQPVLKGRWLTAKWGAITDISKAEKAIFELGFGETKENARVFWVQGSDLLSRTFTDEWLDEQVHDRQEFEKKTSLVITGKGCTTCVQYEAKKTPKTKPQESTFQESIPEVTKSPARPEVAVIVDPKDEPQANQSVGTFASKDSIRKDLENRFWQEAFQLHKDWQDLRSDYQMLLSQREDISRELKASLTEHLEKIVTESISNNYQSNGDLRKDIIKDLKNELTSSIETQLEAKIEDQRKSLIDGGEESSPKIQRMDARLTELNEQLVMLRADLRDVRFNNKFISLDKLQQRIERLEITKASRPDNDKAVANLESRIMVLEKQIGKINQQIAELQEDPEESSSRSIWHRFFGR